MRKKERAALAIDRLKAEYPDADCTLDYNEAWKLLVSVRLAAQCTDERVNVIVKDLFAKYPGIDELARAEPADIEAIVKPCGLGHSKARDISRCMRMLRDEYDSKVPDTMEDLLRLPGVGRKSANLIMGDVFGAPAIVTDTHCIRLCNRIGLVDQEKDPKKVEMALWKIIPPEEGSDFCHRLVYHGREVCTARTKPHCEKCCLSDICREHLKEGKKSEKAKTESKSEKTGKSKTFSDKNNRKTTVLQNETGTKREEKSAMREYTPYKAGKVREIYDNGDNLIMVATDRISAFDVILNNTVTDKGAILTRMSKFWFDFTRDIVPNHMLSVDPEDMPEFFRQEEYRGNSMLCKKLTMLPVECIVRGYITGSGWARYQKDGTVCGIRLPEGLSESQKLPEPLYTPSTKADLGDHDENVSYEKTVEILERQFPGKGAAYAAELKEKTLALYKRCAEYALDKGIIIADTKFEFGLDEKGDIVLGDEMLTPDSSRFWPLAGYTVGKGQPSYDKQFVRDWLTANPDSGYTLPDDIIEKTIAKYKEAYEALTGEPFHREQAL